ncbi:hypothetical protein [African swine fever virus]|nr:hypothetical protein [African swine fever virus]UNZ12493.1 hypothetical protein [African swine fever virus]
MPAALLGIVLYAGRTILLLRIVTLYLYHVLFSDIKYLQVTCGLILPVKPLPKKTKNMKTLSILYILLKIYKIFCLNFI